MSENKGNSLKIPPQSNDSEKAVLGAVMLKPEAINDVLDIINEDAFYSTRHRIIFEAIKELYSEGLPVDLVSISEKLKAKKQIDQAGGRSYLSELVESVPSSANVEYYANLVKNKKTLRDLIEAAEHVSGLGYNENSDVEYILDEAEKKIFNVTNQSNAKTLVKIGEIMDTAWEKIDHLHKNQGQMRGVPTGFEALDNLLSGLQPSDLIILAARPSVGKTSFALDIARHAAVKEKIPVAVFSLEMSSEQLSHRMLAAQSQINAFKLRTGKLNSSDFELLGEPISILSEAPIFIDDKPANNIISMRSTARKLKSEKGLGLIVVDYLQLMMPTQSRNSDNVVQQVTEISRSLKALARELDVPVLALSQLSRAVEQRGGKPRLSDLRDSGSIEQDADVVMFIHREDRYKEQSERDGMAEILIEKHRNGPTGHVQLFFDDTKSSFKSVDKSHGNQDIDNF